MLLLPLLLVLSAAPPEGASAATPREEVLLYEGPEAPDTDPATYRFTTYAPGDTPFLAVDEANLRASASSMHRWCARCGWAARWRCWRPSPSPPS